MGDAIKTKQTTYFGLVIRVRQTGETYKGASLYTSAAQAWRGGKGDVEIQNPHLEVVDVWEYTEA